MVEDYVKQRPMTYDSENRMSKIKRILVLNGTV